MKIINYLYDCFMNYKKSRYCLKKCKNKNCYLYKYFKGE